MALFIMKNWTKFRGVNLNANKTEMFVQREKKVVIAPSTFSVIDKCLVDRLKYHTPSFKDFSQRRIRTRLICI